MSRSSALRIALISFEYAGEAAGGGIGTYVRNAARMLADRGHTVEVFCAASETEAFSTPGVTITQVKSSRADFFNRVRVPFAARHREAPFDVIEGPEYGADAAGIKDDHPNLPLVVRLHTPGSTIHDINMSYVGLRDKMRFLLGGVRRGRWPSTYWTRRTDGVDAERAHTLAAERIVAPSQAILDKMALEWDLPRERCEVIPNVFIPPPDLLRLEPSPASREVLFLGKLEVRKGVIELARAVPLVAREIPEVRFVFVGRSLPMPGSGRPVREIMRELYGAAGGRVEHIDAVPYADVPKLFEKAAVAVFPSVWENFPNVCLEAMAAARGVVASSAGGMSEMIEQGRTGLLVPPRDPPALARAIVELLRDPRRSRMMGLAARAYVLDAFGPARTGPLQEAALARTIAAAQARDHDGRPRP